MPLTHRMELTNRRLIEKGIDPDTIVHDLKPDEQIDAEELERNYRIAEVYVGVCLFGSGGNCELHWISDQVASWQNYQDSLLAVRDGERKIEGGIVQYLYDDPLNELKLYCNSCGLIRQGYRLRSILHVVEEKLFQQYGAVKQEERNIGFIFLTDEAEKILADFLERGKSIDEIWDSLDDQQRKNMGGKDILVFQLMNSAQVVLTSLAVLKPEQQ
jgi:hypothetical protein